MIIKILRYILLFISPFMIYGLWLAIIRRRTKGSVTSLTLKDMPIYRLSLIGFILVIIGLIFLGFSQGENNSGKYIPPHVVDGDVIPGELKP